MPNGPAHETARRRALAAEVARLAEAVGAAILEARAVNLPVEPGAREARDVLRRWAAMLGELLDQWGSSA